MPLPDLNVNEPLTDPWERASFQVSFLTFSSLGAAEVPWPAQELDSGTGLGAGLGDSSGHQS